MVGSISDRFSKWGTSIAAVAARHPNLTRAAGVATGVLAALFLVVGGGAIVLAALVAPFAALSAAATLLGIGLLPLIGIAAGVVLVIGALAAAGYLIYAKWDGIAEWFTGLWTRVSNGASTAVNDLISKFTAFSPLALLIEAFAPAMSYLSNLDFAGFGSHLIDGLIGGITRRMAALKSVVVGVASSVSNWFKEKLGIHSPSRVFAALGGHVMAGLDQGLADNASNPLARITDLSGQMTRALAVGASSAAIAAASPLAAQAPMNPSGNSIASAPPAAPATYNLHFHGISSDPQDIEDVVARVIEKIERERRGRGFGDNGG
jgi:phage-related minor tail protein